MRGGCDMVMRRLRLNSHHDVGRVLEILSGVNRGVLLWLSMNM